MAADDGRSLGDPEEHPEQHAALKTGKQDAGQPEKEKEDDEGFLAHEEHSDAEGPFGTG